MVEGIAEFKDSDRFLRRVFLSDHFKKSGLVTARAFIEKHAKQLSWTMQDESLQAEGAIDAYREHWAEQMNGTLPGLLYLTFLALTRLVTPPLAPQWAPDENDTRYGHLHCATPVPDEVQRAQLAKIANDGKEGDILCRVVKPS